MRALVLLFALASAAEGQAVLTGFVREDSTLQPLRDAEVTVLERSARTDATGKFTLSDLPTGQQQVRIRRVGYEPSEMTIEFKAGTQERVFYLTRSATQLDTISVAGRKPRGIGREAFAERRALGLGKFIDSTELRANEHKKLQDLLRQTGVRVVIPVRCDRGNGILEPYCEPEPGSKRVAVSASTSVECPMQVVIDGVTLYRHRSQGAMTLNGKTVEWATTYDLSTLMVSFIESVEIYRRTSEVPIEFGGSGAACGALVVWTRRR